MAQDLEHRVKRFINGENNRDDIPRFFQWARDKLKEGDPVRDVGDFDAHREERVKGLTWETGRAFCAMMRIGPLGKTAGVSITANDLKLAVLASTVFARRASDAERSGIPYEKIVEFAKGAVAKLQSFDGTMEKFSSPLTPGESFVYHYIRSRRSVPYAFSAYSLTNDLADLLIRSNFLENSDRTRFLSRRCEIAIFAISRMHLANINLKNIPGRAIIMAGTSSLHPDKVVAHIEYTFPEFERQVSIVRVVATDCSVREWVDPKLWPIDRGPFEELKDWNIPLDLDEKGRLAPFPDQVISLGALRPIQR